MEYSASFTAFCRNLEIPANPDALPYFQQGVALYQERGNEIFSAEHLLTLNETYHFYRKPDFLAAVLEAARLMRQKPDFAVYNYALYACIQAHGNTALLPAPDFQSIETDFSPLFAFIYCFDALIASMKARHLPLQVISDTLQGFESEMNDYRDMYGRLGMRRYIGWFLLFVYGELIRVGRLNFQMTTLDNPIRVYRKGDDLCILMDDIDLHQKGMLFGSAGQDDDAGRYHASITVSGNTVTGYPANRYGEATATPVTLVGYEEVLRCGDKVISVHIPANEPFTPDLCQASYERAAEVFRTCYPDFDCRAFVCYSWMMEKRLRDIMGRDTNITRFAEKFHGFPLKDSGGDVYLFLYHLPAPATPAIVPENSSMQRAVKQYLLAGNYYYEKGGLFLAP